MQPVEKSQSVSFKVIEPVVKELNLEWYGRAVAILSKVFDEKYAVLFHMHQLNKNSQQHENPIRRLTGDTNLASFTLSTSKTILAGEESATLTPRYCATVVLSQLYSPFHHERSLFSPLIDPFLHQLKEVKFSYAVIRFEKGFMHSTGEDWHVDPGELSLSFCHSTLPEWSTIVADPGKHDPRFKNIFDQFVEKRYDTSSSEGDIFFNPSAAEELEGLARTLPHFQVIYGTHLPHRGPHPSDLKDRVITPEDTRIFMRLVFEKNLGSKKFVRDPRFQANYL